MKNTIIKKLGRPSRIVYISVVMLLILLIVLFVGMLFFMRLSVPDNPQQMSNTICIHFEGNRGSNEDLVIFSYYCNSSPDWEIVMNPPSALLHRDEDCYENNRWDIAACALPGIWEEQGILDHVYTMECPMIKIQNNKIEVRQNRVCSWLAHDYPEPTYLEFYVDDEGIFMSSE